MKYFVLFLLGFAVCVNASGQTEKKLTILHTNDLHSRLTGYSPESLYTPLSVNDDKTVGGFARIAGIIKEEKAKNSSTTIVVDAGDFLMGTLFQGIETTTGFQLRLMKKMGYDVVCLGNHEFDYGPEKLAEIIGSSVKNGEIPSILLSNAVFDKEDPRDDALEKLYAGNIIGRTLVLDRDGLKTGFFSLMGKVADENAAFAPPVTFSKQVSSARKMVKSLREQGCEIVICLSHSGVGMDKDGNWTGEDVELAEKVKGIDIIISGHTHTRLDKPIMVNGIPVVQTGEYGQNVGKLSVKFVDGKVTVESSSLIPVDDRIPGDRAIHELIEKQKTEVDRIILQQLGMEYDKSIAESAFMLECNEQGDFEGSNLGPLVADAIHSYVNRYVKSGTDVSMVAVGVIRDRIMPGFQSAPDIFRIMSMGMGNDNIPGYPLATLYVTGKELKSILEILQVAYKSTPANYCYYSGIRVEHDPQKGMLKKISRIEIVSPDGTKKNVDFSKRNGELYAVTANSYMLQFIGIIKKMSFGLINVVPKDKEGNPVADMKSTIIDIDESKAGLQEGKEWLAIYEYLSLMKDLNGNGIPDIEDKYKVPVKSFFSVLPLK